MPLEYADYEYAVAAVQLLLAMLGMGATLTLTEFRAVARRPRGVVFVLIAQFILMPIVAVVAARLFGLTAGIAFGLIVITAMPSGALSNIFAYLGRGNVPLSITATCASTASCLVLTPLVMRLFAGAHLPSGFDMPTGAILGNLLFCLLVPLGIGMAINYRWRHGSHGFAKWCVRASLVALTLLVIGSLTSGRIDPAEYGWKVPMVLIGFAAVGLVVTQGTALLFRWNFDDAFTMGIEVAMRNCNVALLIKAALFPAVAGQLDPMGDAVLFVALFYGGACLGIAAIPVVRRSLLAYLRQERIKREHPAVPPPKGVVHVRQEAPQRQAG